MNARERLIIVLLAISLAAHVLLFAFVLMRTGNNAGAGLSEADRTELLAAVFSTQTAREATQEAAPAQAIAQATQPPAVTGSGGSTQTDAAAPATPTPVPTMVPSPTPEPTLPPPPTATPPPTSTPAPTAIPATGPSWLAYMNMFRAEAGLPPLVENPEWSEGSTRHSRYMVYSGNLWHDEDPFDTGYTASGAEAARNSNIAANFLPITGPGWAFNYWISAPFHAVPILDAELASTGFGMHADQNGRTEVAATLDIKRGLLSVPETIQFPVLFPRDGGKAWVLRFSLPEFPDGRSSCGYGTTSGAPIIVQIGDGSQIPSVSGATVTRSDGLPAAVCYYDETSYFNPDSRDQQTGRQILDQRDAIIILPREPLEVGWTYNVTLSYNGTSISWSFETVEEPAQGAIP